jgi:putative Holliday junction resolvase
MKRILGIDLGGRRTGVAITDLTGTLASGLELVEASGLTNCAKKIIEICNEHDMCDIVPGYPLNMNGTVGEAALRSEKFKEILENLANESGRGLTIILFDERLSTSLAHVYMNETGVKNRRGKIDMLSASIILQDYIDSKNQALPSSSSLP